MISAIPEGHDIARYASASKIDPETGRLLGAAFYLRPGEEYLSVFCLSMIKGDDTLSQIEYLKKDIPLDTSPNGRLGVLNIGEMKEYVRSSSKDKRDLTVTGEPRSNPKCPELNCEYHCGIRGFGYAEEIIAELIVECVKDEYPTLRKSKYSRKEPDPD